MNGNVFECYDEQTDRRRFLSKAVEALEGYAKKSLKYAEDLASSLFGTETRLPALEKQWKPGAEADEKETRTAWQHGCTPCSNMGTMQRGHEGKGEVTGGIHRQCCPRQLRVVSQQHQSNHHAI